MARPQSADLIQIWAIIAQVDEPSQRKQTRTGSGAQFAWEEAFSMWVSSLSSSLFAIFWAVISPFDFNKCFANGTYFREITVHSSELLFEVWDQVRTFQYLLNHLFDLWKYQTHIFNSFLFQGQKIGKSDAFMGLGIGKMMKKFLPLFWHVSMQMFSILALLNKNKQFLQEIKTRVKAVHHQVQYHVSHLARF